MRLTIPQRQKLHAALLGAFPGHDELALLTDLYFGEPLPNISTDAAMPYMVMKVIVWAEARGRVPELIDAARNANPTNPELLEFCRLFEARAEAAAAPVTVPRPGPLAATAVPRGSAAPPRPDLERVVLKSVEFAHVEQWRANMAARERTVCRVEYPIGQGQGTGFLVAPDLVMTACHVLEPFVDGKQAWSLVRFRFGYRADATGKMVHEGQAYATASGEVPALVASSPVDQLDFAIVRLASAAGNDAVDGAAGAPTRGYLDVHRRSFEAGEPIFIIQHPEAAPLRITSGAFVGETGQQIQYQANTLPGSSGSPCFTANWKLVALHRGSDGDANMGVPFRGIVPDLVNRGLGSILTVVDP